jgi:hypothetical protein
MRPQPSSAPRARRPRAAASASDHPASVCASYTSSARLCSRAKHHGLPATTQHCGSTAANSTAATSSSHTSTSPARANRRTQREQPAGGDARAASAGGAQLDRRPKAFCRSSAVCVQMDDRRRPRIRCRAPEDRNVTIRAASNESRVSFPKLITAQNAGVHGIHRERPYPGRNTSRGSGMPKRFPLGV